MMSPHYLSRQRGGLEWVGFGRSEATGVEPEHSRVENREDARLLGRKEKARNQPMDYCYFTTLLLIHPCRPFSDLT